MTSTINISYQNATFTASNSIVSVGNGGSIALANNQNLSLSGTFPFNTLNVSSGAIVFGSMSGAAVNGELRVPVAASGGDPSIMASNFSGEVMVSWETDQGPQFQSLVPGNPITLSGFTG